MKDLITDPSNRKGEQKNVSLFEKKVQKDLEEIQAKIAIEKMGIRDNELKLKRLNFRGDWRRSFEGQRQNQIRSWNLSSQKEKSQSKEQFRSSRNRKGETFVSFNETRRQRNVNGNYKFYGLAQSATNIDQGLSNEVSLLYQSKYAKSIQNKNEEINFKPTEMTTLVTKPNQKVYDDNIDKFGSEQENIQKENCSIKNQRLNALTKLKTDENILKCSRRLFGFMIKHLGKAKKEQKSMKNTTLKFMLKAKKLREKQSEFIQKAYRERQKEKYRNRLEHRNNKMKYLKWKRLHSQNVLLASKMKSDFLKYSDVLNTKTEPMLFFKLKIENVELMEIFQKELDKSSTRLRNVVEKRLEKILEAEGECPSEPKPLPFEIDNSPPSVIFPNEINRNKTKSLISRNNKNFFNSRQLQKNIFPPFFQKTTTVKKKYITKKKYHEFMEQEIFSSHSPKKKS